MQEQMDKYQRADHDWLACMCRIGRKQLAVFEDHSEQYAEMLVHTNCTRHIMVWVYETIRAKKLITPIEHLDKDTKKQMWMFVLDVCKGKTNNITIMKEMSMVFYTFEYFLNEKTR